ncbi:MAG: amidohydrolase family protein [Victivallales bacterium]|nr:amidohydrolase family protein [Victivallales bacterium]
MKIFDVHTHVWPDALALRVVAHLQKQSNMLPVYSDGTAADLRRHAIAAGYDGWMNCPVVTRPNQSHSVNEHAAAANQWPSLSMGALHPDDDDVCGEIHHIMDLGLHGIKLHPEYQSFYPTEAKMEPIWTLAENHQLPVIIHAGNDVGFEPPYHSCPADFAEVVRRHPGLTLICAHMGGWMTWEEVERDLVGHPVYLDTSFASSYMRLQPGQFERIIRNHGIDRVLFGTDSPWQPMKASIDDILDLPFTDAEKQKILYGNAQRMFRFE